MKPSKILVTGSSGMIGTRLCEELLARNYHVTGFDLKPNRWISKVNERTVIGDLRDPSSLGAMSGNWDVVVHLAGNARVYELVVNPVLARESLQMVMNVLEFMRLRKLPKIIYASSREVYGNRYRIRCSENASAHVEDCESPYAASKLGGEAMIHAYHHCYGLNYIILRFSNVYGRYDNSDRVIPLFIKLARGNKEAVIYGKRKLLDFTYIDDAVEGIIKAIERFERAGNDVFNIASGEAVSLVHVARLIKKYMPANNNIIMADNRTGEVVRFAADITKAKRKLAYKPKTGIELGIQKTIKWYAQMK
ncbi:MAG TPA: NAD-dependent epimerase/dehydratase family protein [Candidatus Bathyarchaeia archaeon]|nr:NAD-dependent epimerase/dehydratase family protein [Candidatus Bathyarchaeia archaeon]